MKKIDIIFINPGDRKQVFQNLGSDLAGIEPPFWIVVLAAFLRKNGFTVSVIDSNAENISPQETAKRISDLDPLIACVIVYGSQPSASTQNMTNAGRICTAIKEVCDCKIALGGLHPSALPKRTIEEESVDFVIEGEGPITILELLNTLKKRNTDFSKVPGLWYYDQGLKSNPRPKIIQDLNLFLPLGAWDLLPMGLYRAHNWHCFDDIENRQPYAAIYTSLGCPYNCVFCCINAPFGKPGIRYRSPDLVIDEIQFLVQNYGIKNLKIVDELFVLNENHYMAIVDKIIQLKIVLNIWCYSRVDTIKPENLRKMKKAGINWLALGIETANPEVRNGAKKCMKTKDIKDVVRRIQDKGIRVIGNYIFGLPDDSFITMEETLQMAIDLNCEFANFYSAMAYPGSRLYDIAIGNGWELPKEWHGFSQHSYHTLPLPTKYLSAKDVLKFRDDSFHRYFNNEVYLEMIEDKFGAIVKNHIIQMSSVKLKRKLFED